MFFIAYVLKGKDICVCRASENCKLLFLQDKYNIEIFLFPGSRVVNLGTTTKLC